jgi:hypothetical protein
MFWNSGKVETEKHFILECEALKDRLDSYVSILTASSWNDLFNQGTEKCDRAHRQAEQEKD